MTARERARIEITAEIVASAREQLGDVGAAALSLRAVARELGMASSAVYRYFESRDALLTALIVEAFDAVGVAAEDAMAEASGDVEERWLALARSVRAWAIDNPHDYALVYGSPVPGYRAPDDTVTPAARVSLVMLRLLADGITDGDIDIDSPMPVPRPVHADLRNLRDVTGLDLPDEVLGRGLAAWTGLFGSISYELFGHLFRVVEDYDAFFDHQMRRLGRLIVSG
jgi:AcrR family transcriptional regulator